MKKIYIILIAFLTLKHAPAPGQSHANEIREFQEELNHEYNDPETSPLTKKDRKKFTGLEFFPIDEAYYVTARFTKTENPSPFKMKTTTSRRPTYDKYGEATFDLNGQAFTLNIYQSHKLRETEEYKDYLFLPFTDLTNGEETYGGGRFIDLSIPAGDSIVIDFNKAYNPYCAYNHNYSCPIPPAENDMDVKVKGWC